MNVGYNKDRLVLPDVVHGTQLGAVTLMDIEVKE